MAQTRAITQDTLDCYRKGLVKLAEFLRLRCHKRPQGDQLGIFHGPLPEWLQKDVRSLVDYCGRSWGSDQRWERAGDLLCSLTRPLRWIAARYPLEIWPLSRPRPGLPTWMPGCGGDQPQDHQPRVASLKHLLFHLRDQGRAVCERLLLVDYLRSKNLPWDVPLEHLRALQQEIRRRAASPRANLRPDGIMDLAWFLLMLHSGLRTGEVRFLRLADIDWEGKRLRIEQSKGLKDRLVFLSQESPSQPCRLTWTCAARQKPCRRTSSSSGTSRSPKPTASSACTPMVSAWDLCQSPPIRHSNATLLLNAGAPVLTVQTLLGHKWVDTTLGYARCTMAR